MLPMNVRNEIAREWQSIKRAYKSEENRQTALDMVVARIKTKHPEYFILEDSTQDGELTSIPEEQ